MDASKPTEIGGGFGKTGVWRSAFRALIHRLSYRFVYEQKRTRYTRAAGFDLVVLPTVFHPRWFITSAFFASVIDKRDLTGKRAADVCTGSGILALAAARAGAASVTAIDVNPQAARCAAENAIRNGFAGRVTAICSNLFEDVPAGPQFDLITASPPSFAGEPLDVADRAWHAGPQYRDIAGLFEQARDRLLPDGSMLLLLSSDSDIPLMEHLWTRAGFRGDLIASKSIVLESFPLYELRQTAS